MYLLRSPAMYRAARPFLASPLLRRPLSVTSALRTPDYYQILKVPRTATADELKAAFHEQAKLHHPDVQGSSAAAAETFKAINEAYSVLADSAERELYDASTATGAAADPTEVLRRRNEGPGAMGPRDIGLDPTYAGYTAGQRGSYATDQAAYELAAQRAAERTRSGTRARAGSQRVNRARIDVPTHSETAMKLAYPLAILVLWVFIWAVFVRPGQRKAAEALEAARKRGGPGSSIPSPSGLRVPISH